MRATPLERFEAKVLKEHGPGGCWLWTASCNNHGYGTFYIGTCRADGRHVMAHRWSYEHFVGPIPDGLELDHLCSTPACSNPLHLEPVTHRVNLLRGATIPAAHAAKTHCPSGHPYDEQNTYIAPRGNRKCRSCNRDRARKRRRASSVS